MFRTLLAVLAIAAMPASAQEKSFTLHAPKSLIETGFLKHLLPRFSLKTGVRIKTVEGNADAKFAAQGTAVFAQDGIVWHFDAIETPRTEAFEKWLLSDVGKRTIEAYAPDGTPLFSADVSVTKAVEATVLTGDAVLGEKISLKQCGRCHVVNASNRMKTIGSTPSFALMRTFPDWQERFETFFMLRPHPAFTQVSEITEPFADNLPSPIAPIEVTWDQIEAITAYVGSIEPANLGAPLQSQ
ncbi:hypothetical protein [Planktotalea sp.]|uniref:hypothetical protein n=1 Tax=Planktotalea sp. TaxID=2029877 RepID=UPI003D6AA60A